MLFMYSYYKELDRHTPLQFQSFSSCCQLIPRYGPWKKCVTPKDNYIVKMEFEGTRGEEGRTSLSNYSKWEILYCFFLPFKITVYIEITYWGKTKQNTVLESWKKSSARNSLCDLGQVTLLSEPHFSNKGASPGSSLK